MTLLYIDPGTGSMLFSLFVGLAVAATFATRALVIKLKFIFTGGKAKKEAALISYCAFSDHKRYYNVFKPILDEFERRKIPLTYYTASEDDPLLDEKYEFIARKFIGSGNKPYMRLNFLKADILIATTPNLDVYQWKRSPDTKCYIHIPHSVDELAAYKMFALDYYDAVLTAGNAQNEFIRKIESLRPAIKRKELFTVGSLPLDFLKAKADKAKKKTKNEKAVVLLAPSWGESALLSKYGESLLQELSKTDFHVIIRPHPQSVVSEQPLLRKLTEKFSSLEWNYDNDNFDVLCRADILITDFSAIVFDFAFVFKKPVIYSVSEFDTSTYDADWLNEDKWSLRILPSLGKELKKEELSRLKEIIEDELENNPLREKRDAVMQEAWSNVGGSAKEAVDKIIEIHRRLEEKSSS